MTSQRAAIPERRLSDWERGLSLRSSNGLFVELSELLAAIHALLLKRSLMY